MVTLPFYSSKITPSYSYATLSHAPHAHPAAPPSSPPSSPCWRSCARRYAHWISSAPSHGRISPSSCSRVSLRFTLIISTAARARCRLWPHGACFWALRPVSSLLCRTLIIAIFCWATSSRRRLTALSLFRSSGTHRGWEKMERKRLELPLYARALLQADGKLNYPFWLCSTCSDFFLIDWNWHCVNTKLVH